MDPSCFHERIRRRPRPRGNFATAGGVPAAGIARHGNQWSSFGSGIYVNNRPGTVATLAAYNGDLYAGGTFTSAGGLLMANMVWWDGVQWNEMIMRPDYGVNAMVVHNNQLVVAGYIQHVGSLAVNRVAAWDGTDWYEMGPDSRAAWHVWGVNGQLIAGGSFAGGIARWNVRTGNRWARGCPAATSTRTGQRYGGSATTSSSAEHSRAPGGVSAVNSRGGTAQTGRRWERGCPATRITALTTYKGRVVAGGGGARIRYWDGAMWQTMGQPS